MYIKSDYRRLKAGAMVNRGDADVDVS